MEQKKIQHFQNPPIQDSKEEDNGHKCLWSAPAACTPQHSLSYQDELSLWRSALPPLPENAAMREYYRSIDIGENGSELPHDPTEISPLSRDRLNKLLEFIFDIYKDEQESMTPGASGGPAVEHNRSRQQNWETQELNKDQNCAFCKANGEENYFHPLKDKWERVVCPVLFKYKCKLCGATGHQAHTQKFCPENPITRGRPAEAGIGPGLLPPALTFKGPLFRRK